MAAIMEEGVSESPEPVETTKLDEDEGKEEEDLEDGEIDDDDEDGAVQSKAAEKEEGEAEDDGDDDAKRHKSRSRSRDHHRHSGERRDHHRHKDRKRDRRDLDSDEEKRRKLQERIHALEMQMGGQGSAEDLEELGEEEEEEETFEDDSYAQAGRDAGRRSRSPRGGSRRQGDGWEHHDRKRRRMDGPGGAGNGLMGPSPFMGMGRNFGQHGMQGGRRGDRREKSSEICQLYMQGKCPKDHCMYSHDAEPPKIMELCKFYLFERCAKKEKCLYLHKGFPCKYFHTGQDCLDTAESCKFSHGPLTDETRSILLKHLETAPKEILGDFPRMTREAAAARIFAVEAKAKGWVVPPPAALAPPLEKEPASLMGTPPPNFSSVQEKLVQLSRQPVSQMDTPPLSHDGDSGGERRRRSRWQEDEGAAFLSGLQQAGINPRFPLPPPGLVTGPPMNMPPMNVPPMNVPPPSALRDEHFERFTPQAPHSRMDDPERGFGRGGIERDYYENTPPPNLPKTQMMLFERIQKRQKEADSPEKEGNRNGANDEREFRPRLDESWYSSDEEKEGPSTSNGKSRDSRRASSENAQTAPSRTPEASSPTGPVSLPKELSGLFNSIGGNSTLPANETNAGPSPSSRINRDPRGANRDPRGSSGDGLGMPPPPFTPALEPPSFGGGFSAPGGGGRDPRRKQTEAEENADRDRRILEMDLNSVFGDLELPLAPETHRPFSDVSANPMGLPFKPHPMGPVAVEIDASIMSHSPLEYKLRPVRVFKPDYSDVMYRQRILPSAAQQDPRLRRYLRGSDGDEPGPTAAVYSPSQEVHDLYPKMPMASSSGYFGPGPQAGGPPGRRDPRKRLQ